MAVGRVGDRAAGGEGLPGRRRPVSRADAPLGQPGPGPAGTRRLGRRHRDDPRRRPRRRPRRGPRPERDAAPGSPSSPARSPHGRTRRAVIAAIRAGRTGYTALTRELGEIPHRHRPEPAPRPQGEMRPAPSGTPAARTPPPASPRPSSPSPTRPPDQRKHRRPARNAQTRRPVEPAVTRHDTPASGMPADRKLPTVTKTAGPLRHRNTQMPKAHGIAPSPPTSVTTTSEQQ